MAHPLLAERRFATRRRLTGLMPGRLLRDGDKIFDCRPVDISTHGLGVIANEELPVGSILKLETHDDAFELEVVWRQPDFGKKDQLRYGLVAKSPKTDLEGIFLEAGCLK